MNKPTKHIDNLLVVIVLYKTTLPKSDSYQSITEGFRSLLEQGYRVDLLVVNNGPLSLDCQADDSVFKLHFVQQLDNPGVSKAYNIAGDLADRLGKRWLLLLDQDTKLPRNFWIPYSQSLSRYPNLPIHTPRLYAGTVLASPCGYRFYRGYVLSNLVVGAYPMEGHNVLNSGLMVNVDAFRKVGGYDETVRLYFSDFVFFDRLKRVYDTFAVVDLDLAHDLSSSDYSSSSIAMNRFSLYCQGARAAAKGEIIKSTAYFLTVGARSIVMGRRFNSLAFTQSFLRIWFEKSSTKQ